MAIPVEQFTAILTGQEPALPLDQREQLAGYLALVSQYSRVLGLTSFRDPAVIAGELVGEALRLLRLAPLATGGVLTDLGSGNGTPVIPLAICQPALNCTALEAGARRAAFLRQAAALLKLPNLAVAEVRVEEWAQRNLAASDFVTSRAFAPPPKLLPLARQLLVPRGEVRGFTGADATELEQTAELLGFRIEQLERYQTATATRHAYRLVRE